MHATRRRSRVVHAGGRRRARGASGGSASAAADRNRSGAGRAVTSQRCRCAVAERPSHVGGERTAFDAMIRMFLCAGFGQKLELGRSQLDGAPRRFVEPIEARIESRITTGGVARQREVGGEARFDARRLAVNPKKQQLGGCLGQVKEGKEKEAKSILLERVESRLYSHFTLARDAAGGDPRLDASFDWLYEASRRTVELRTAQLELLPEASA